MLATDMNAPSHRDEPQIWSPPPAREVSIRELDRRAGSVVAEVTDEGSVIAVTRWGLPVALILPLAEAIRLLPADYVMSGDLGELSARFVARSQARDRSKLRHGREGRWWED
jgi:prevent-host-death family protein